MVIRKWMDGVMYCINLSMNNGSWCVVEEKKISGNVVIILVFVRVKRIGMLFRIIVL